MTIVVEHDPARGRFHATVQGHLCVCDYRMRDGAMVFTHTEVAPELEGRGVAAQLVKAALEHARTHGLKVRPLCSYVRSYIVRHAEYQPLLA